MCPLARPTHRVRVGGAGKITQRENSYQMNVTFGTYFKIATDLNIKRCDLVVFRVKVIGRTQGDTNSGVLYSKWCWIMNMIVIYATLCNISINWTCTLSSIVVTTCVTISIHISVFYPISHSPLHPCFCGNRWVLLSIYWQEVLDSVLYLTESCKMVLPYKQERSQTQSMPEHSMGLLCLWELLCKCRSK